MALDAKQFLTNVDRIDGALIQALERGVDLGIHERNPGQGDRFQILLKAALEKAQGAGSQIRTVDFETRWNAACQRELERRYTRAGWHRVKVGEHVIEMEAPRYRGARRTNSPTDADLSGHEPGVMR